MIIPPRGSAPPVDIALTAVHPPSREARASATTRAIEGSLATVTALKDIKGTGQELAGAGDPRIPERRAAVSNLLAAGDLGEFETRQVKKVAKQDVHWLESAERRDFSERGWSSQFKWADNSRLASGVVTRQMVQAHFKSYLAHGEAAAKRFHSGEIRYLDVSDGNLGAIQYLEHPTARAHAMTDALLQMRARTDSGGLSQFTNSTGGPAPGRLDLVGPAQTAVERQWLARAALGLHDPASRLDYALTRELAATSSAKSGNNIFKARNAVGALFKAGGRDVSWSSRTHDTAWVKFEVPPGAHESPYEAIHHNYSRQTARDVSAMVEQWLAPGLGPVEARGPLFERLVGAMELAGKGEGLQARDEIHALAAKHPELRPLDERTQTSPPGQIAHVVESFLSWQSAKPLGPQPAETLSLAAQLYRVVCQEQPTVESLQKELFHAGAAYPEVAAVLAQMQERNPLGTLQELGNARLALQQEIVRTPHGHLRQSHIFLDADLNRLMAEELGAAVERVGNLESDGQKTEALIAIQSALKGLSASGLDSVRDAADPLAGKGPRLEDVLAEIDGAFARGHVSEDAYRGLMRTAHRFAVHTAQDIRSFFDSRASAVASGGIELDPFFLDQFLKQSPLHYLTALSEKGLRVGLHEEIGPRRIANVQGMRVLNGIGPTVFPRAIIAGSGEDLARLHPPRDALAVVHSMSEKKLVMAGGLLVDTRDAPGGNSHLNVYGMNNGIPVIALPELSRAYGEFFENAEREGGIYLDDRDGFQMMTLALAREQGLVTDANLASLRPGVNRTVTFLAPRADGQGFEPVMRHAVHVAPNRPTREVELYLPLDQVHGKGHTSMSFDELGAMGTYGRHLAGEKGVVLALLRSDPYFRNAIPDGSVVTTGRVRSLLAQSGLAELWQSPWTTDPAFPDGRVTDQNFTRSAFYTSPAYRSSVRENLRAQTDARLHQALLTRDAAGNEQLTPLGVQLYGELSANDSLRGSPSWIARSSFTGEDRPGKSGAGQYESYPNLQTPVARIKGVIGVIRSAWDAEPVENNVSEEINLQHIMPSVVVQECLNPQVSGVAVSHDAETHARNRVTYQLVKGFGGGVEGGAAEEGVIGRSQHTVNVEYPGASAGLASSESLQGLRSLVLDVEKFFDARVEPGKNHTVDVEVARQGDTWKVVQARVLLND